jgi:SseB protein C-terminal domain/SseB protein N-terminal domain
MTELERELALAAAEPTMPPRLRQALLRAEVLVPVPGPVPEDPSALRIEAGEKLELPVWKDAGMSFVPVFTSEAELARATEEPTGYLRVPVRVLADALRDGPPLGINSRSPHRYLVPVGALAGRETFPEGARFAIGEPAVEPAELLRAMEEFLRDRDDVVRAWRALVRLPDRPPEPLVGLELVAGADPDAVIPAALEHAERAAPGRVTFVAVDRGQPDEFADYLLAREPFWTAGQAA